MDRQHDDLPPAQITARRPREDEWECIIEQFVPRLGTVTHFHIFNDDTVGVIQAEADDCQYIPLTQGYELVITLPGSLALDLFDVTA